MGRERMLLRIMSGGVNQSSRASEFSYSKINPIPETQGAKRFSKSGPWNPCIKLTQGAQYKYRFPGPSPDLQAEQGWSLRIQILAGTLDHCDPQAETPFNEPGGIREGGQEGNPQLCQDTVCICEFPHRAPETP